MAFLILYILALSTAVYKIDAGNCAERKCVTGFVSWCCSFSSTCGTVGVCNSTTVTLRDTRCPGQQACYSIPYYWCCNTDQTCGGIATCKGGTTYNTLAIIKYVSIGISVLGVLCGLCACIVRHQRQFGPNNQIGRQVHTPRVQASPYSFTNMGRATQPNPLQQSFTIPRSSVQVTQNQEAPPPSYSISVPSIGNDESKI